MPLTKCNLYLTKMSGTLTGGELVLAQRDPNEDEGGDDCSMATGTSLGTGTSMGTGTFDVSPNRGLQSEQSLSEQQKEKIAEEIKSGLRKQVVPRAGTLVAFDNMMLQHCVGTLKGSGRRRIVSFHLVHPQHVQRPRASAQPRALRAAAVLDTAIALYPLRLAPQSLRRICEYATEETRDAATTLAQRDQERRRRLRGFDNPDPLRRNLATGFFFRQARLQRQTTGYFPRQHVIRGSLPRDSLSDGSPSD